VRSLFGEEVATVERPPANVVRPAAPDLEDVEPTAELVAAGPQCQHRAFDPAAGGGTRLIVLVVDRRTRAIVLADGMTTSAFCTAAKMHRWARLGPIGALAQRDLTGTRY
jgi:hypothetical protein